MMCRAAVTPAPRPYAELVREADKARLLLEAARYLGESLEPERVYDRFHELLADVVEHDGAVVYGAAETLLGREDLTEEQRRQLLQMISAQAARLTTITESVLLTSRLDRGDLPFERESVDVAELARTTVETLRTQVPESVALEVEAGPEVVNAAGDADRIQQVLVNLLDNAVKYGDGSPVTVRVDPANGVVRLSVQDRGPGLSPAEQARVFEKFYRAGPQLTRTGGTGLGLYISRELARRMGGRLDVRSEPGVGATFVLELPRS